MHKCIKDLLFACMRKPMVQIPGESTLMTNDDAIDRISDLPDPILCKILSYLPTKFAVGTCILSTRWNNLRAFVYPPINLDLDDYLFLYRKNKKLTISHFKKFVDKLLFITLRDVPCVESMKLKCLDNYSDNEILSWVSAALGLNVRSLLLEIHLKSAKALFISLNGCTTLVSLEFTNLSTSPQLIVPDNFSLPSLKRLFLENLEFLNLGKGSINEMINGCPVLEELRISSCALEVEGSISIQSTLFKSLNISDTFEGDDFLDLNSPNVELLTFGHHPPNIAFVASFKSPVAAHIDFDMHYDVDDDDYRTACTNIGKIVAACSNTKSLYMSECSITALYFATMQPLQQFQNLTRLALGSVGLNGWNVLAGLLFNAPILEHLVFEETFEDYCEDGYLNFESAVSSTPLPCLEFHLKKIEVWEFCGKEEEIKLIEYFLKNGIVLQTLELRCHRLNDKSTLQRVRGLPGGMKIRICKTRR